MKVLSLHQPWASLMAAGYKMIETRTWPMPQTVKRGDLVAIHASKRWNADLRKVCQDQHFHFFLTHAEKRGLWDFKRPPLGCVVALVQFDRCEPTEALIEHIASREYSFGNYSDGLYGWVFEGVVPIKPIALRGHQDLFDWQPALNAIKQLEPWRMASRTGVAPR